MADHTRPIDRPLTKDRSFWGIVSTQFLGAFNDNIFKQTVLLIFSGIPVAGGPPRDLQFVATAVFSLPFVLFSGLAGFFSDRWRKSRVIVGSKVAEIVIMASGIGAFFYFQHSGFSWGFVVLLSTILFCMGAQSAFFGPGKYGILPEIFAAPRLSAANGAILMTTFLAIIFGTALAGILLDSFRHALWAPAAVCVAIAVVGTLTSLLIRSSPAAESSLKFKFSNLGVPHEIRGLLRHDRPLAAALVASCVFWGTGAIVQPAVNILGSQQLAIRQNSKISLLVSMVGFGIAAGSALSGYLSRGRIRWGLLRGGALGIVGCLVLVGVSLPGGRHMLGYGGSLMVLFLLGVSTGFFAVPLQVFLQTRPPAALKGRMLAAQNLLNWIAIFASSGVYYAFNSLIAATGWPVSTMFLMAALLMLPVLIWYRPGVMIKAGDETGNSIHETRENRLGIGR